MTGLTLNIAKIDVYIDYICLICLPKSVSYFSKPYIAALYLRQYCTPYILITFHPVARNKHLLYTCILNMKRRNAKASTAPKNMSIFTGPKFSLIYNKYHFKYNIPFGKGLCGQIVCCPILKCLLD